MANQTRSLEEGTHRWNSVYRDNPDENVLQWGAAGGVDFGADPLSLENDARQKVAKGSAALSRTSDSLARSIQVAEETEVIGAEVAGELGEQRETLLRTRHRLEDVNQELSRIRRLLRSMYVNVIKNKVILVFLIILELLIVIALVYLKFAKK